MVSKKESPLFFFFLTNVTHTHFINSDADAGGCLLPLQKNKRRAVLGVKTSVYRLRGFIDQSTPLYIPSHFFLFSTLTFTSLYLYI